MFEFQSHKRSYSNSLLHSKKPFQTSKSPSKLSIGRTIRHSKSRKSVAWRGPMSPKQSLDENQRLVPTTASEKTSSPQNVNLRLPRLHSPEAELKSPLSPKINKRIVSANRRTNSFVPSFAPQPKTSVQNAVTRCAYKTRGGSIMGRPKKFNQDSFIIQPFLQGVKGQYLFAVCDGHGVYGHQVSSLIKEKLPKAVEMLMQENSTQEELVRALKFGIYEVDRQIHRSNVDISFSGSTLVALLVRGNTVVCANIGDSRVVLGRKTENWQALDLSKDHKPELPAERSRILDSNGRVEPYYDSEGEAMGPFRVWLKDHNIPGLAMSRSLGDSVAAMAGVVSEPEVSAFTLSVCDKFLILASDGIWEFISSQTAVEIVQSAWESGHTEVCCEVLVKEALQRWKQLDDTVDDITVIVIFLNVNS